MPGRRFDVEVLTRASVRSVAYVMGGASAAAQALRCVEEQYGGAAEVCQPVGGSSLIVVPHADLIAAGWSSEGSDDTREEGA